MKKQSKIVLFFLILLIALPGQTAHAITFVPKFISHYNHHNTHHHKLSFLDFVGEHFNGHHNSFNKHEDSKHHEQDECPTNQNNNLVLLTYVIEKKIILDFKDLNDHCFIVKTPLPPYCFTFSEFHSSIWQPPKLK